ncbi:N-lysine methyltransferase KMT5A isoform X2 [Lampetra fluviatilis]
MCDNGRGDGNSSSRNNGSRRDRGDRGNRSGSAATPTAVDPPLVASSSPPPPPSSPIAAPRLPERPNRVEACERCPAGRALAGGALGDNSSAVVPGPGRPHGRAQENERLPCWCPSSRTSHQRSPLQEEGNVAGGGAAVVSPVSHVSPVKMGGAPRRGTRPHSGKGSGKPRTAPLLVSSALRSPQASASATAVKSPSSPVGNGLPFTIRSYTTVGSPAAAATATIGSPTMTSPLATAAAGNSLPRNNVGGRRRNRAKRQDAVLAHNRKVTDYFPVRRSLRRCKSQLQTEEQIKIDDAILCGKEEGLEVREVLGKGRGVFATRSFGRGDFVVEYSGELIGLTEAKTREVNYARDPDKGCYMYYFCYLNKTYCVDATAESGRLGRLLNHSKMGNCRTKLHLVCCGEGGSPERGRGGVPRLILVASRNIGLGEELMYDYGDRSREALNAHPWLKS